MSLQFTQASMDDIRSSTANTGREPQTGGLEELNSKITVIVRQVKQMEIKLDYIENQSEWNNLHFDSIPEDWKEDWATTERKTLHLITNKHNLPAPIIERAHRTSCPQSKGKPQTIVVKFGNFKDRDPVLASVRQNRNCGFVAYQDFSTRVIQKTQELLPRLHSAQEQGFRAYIAYDPVEVSKLVQLGRQDNSTWHDLQHHQHQDHIYPHKCSLFFWRLHPTNHQIRLNKPHPSAQPSMLKPPIRT